MAGGELEQPRHAVVRPSGPMVHVRNFTASHFAHPRMNVVVGVERERPRDGHGPNRGRMGWNQGPEDLALSRAQELFK